MFYKIIPPTDIIVEENLRISFKRTDKELLNSIREYGIKTPPVLNSRNGQYFLIAGYKRLEIIEKLRIKNTEFKIIEDNLTDCEKIIFNINDNLATRELSLYEKLNSLSKMKKYGCEEFSKYISILKISPELIEETDMSILPQKILEMLNNGDFDKKTLSFFKYFNKEQTELLSEYFGKIQFTKSEKRKFIDNLLRAEEMGRDITYFLQKNIDQGKDGIIRELYEIINPQSGKLDEKLFKLKKELKGAKIFATPYFEKLSLKLEIEFEDFNKLRKKLKKLEKQIASKTGKWYED